jgi:hypothetical protein
MFIPFSKSLRKRLFSPFSYDFDVSVEDQIRTRPSSVALGEGADRTEELFDMNSAGTAVRA